MLNKLPKQVRKNVLPKIAKSYEIEKSYRYTQSEPLYTPLYLNLRKAFNYHRVALNRSGLLRVLHSSQETSLKSIENRLDKVFSRANKVLDSGLKYYYLKQYNLTKSLMMESKKSSLSKAQIEELSSITSKIKDFTVKSLAKTIQKHIKDGDTYSKVKVEANSMLKNMAYYRADRISKTELTRAHGDSMMDIKKANRTSDKHWVLCDACLKGSHCQVCKGNYTAGWIPLNKAFPSGHLLPPAHVNCTCGIY